MAMALFVIELNSEETERGHEDLVATWPVSIRKTGRCCV
jgi:hypothetical protein